jgi:hypothetical protein
MPMQLPSRGGVNIAGIQGHLLARLVDNHTVAGQDVEHLTLGVGVPVGTSSWSELYGEHPWSAGNRQVCSANRSSSHR